MTIKQLDNWVTALGKAWVALDTDAALSLVNKEQVEWSESPYEPVLTSWNEIHDVWKTDLARQKDVSFSHQVLACSNGQGVARWQATLTRTDTNQTVSMDGIFLVCLNDQNLCTKFMMWIETKKES